MSTITTKIKLKHYLREFLIHLYGEEPICFPQNSDLLVFLHTYRTKPPKPGVIEVLEETNTELAVPYQKSGRDSRIYNYLGRRAQIEFQKKVHTLFCATLNDYVAQKVHVEHFTWQAAIELFAEEYEITAISLDGLKQKNYRDRDGKRFRRENKFRDLNNVKNEPFFNDIGA